MGVRGNETTVRPQRRGITWMAKGLKQRDLLYVSNGNGTVSVYRYWQRQLVGVLTSFQKPGGECSDFTGNVYITDSEAGKIYEYAHGGKKPVRTIDDSPYIPYGCAVDPKSGDLAVANAGEGTYTAGNIAIYPHGTGTPTRYEGPYDDHFINCAYDDRGDLFANSEIFVYYTFYYDIAFYYLPNRGTQLVPEDLSQPYFSSGWPYVNSLSFDGKSWVVDTRSDLYLYKINVQVDYEGKIELSGAYGIRPVALFRKGLKYGATQAVGVGEWESHTDAAYWKYPAGGDPVGTITQDLDDPLGVAISLGS